MSDLRQTLETWLRVRIEHYRRVEAANPWELGNDGVRDAAERTADVLETELALLREAPAEPPAEPDGWFDAHMAEITCQCGDVFTSSVAFEEHVEAVHVAEPTPPPAPTPAEPTGMMPAHMCGTGHVWTRSFGHIVQDGEWCDCGRQQWPEPPHVYPLAEPSVARPDYTAFSLWLEGAIRSAAKPDNSWDEGYLAALQHARAASSSRPSTTEQE